MAKKIFLGVDGGGSKTSALIVDETMQQLGKGLGGPANFLRVGIEAATEEIEKAISDAVRDAGVPFNSIESAYLGIAGADHPKHRQIVVDSLKSYFPAGNFTVDNDARIALTGAIGLGSGMVVIAGTGSVAFGRNENLEARAGGWGPTLGDEGSGYAIARRGLSAIVRAFDGRSPKTLMTDILCNHYGMCEAEELPYFVYAPSTHANDIAFYVRVVIEAAEAGDTVAKEIFESEGKELGLTVLAVVRRLKLTQIEFPVAHVGGAFHAGELLLDPLRRAILNEAPGAKLQPPKESPVQGAARMAIEGPIITQRAKRV